MLGTWASMRSTRPLIGPSRRHTRWGLGELRVLLHPGGVGKNVRVHRKCRHADDLQDLPVREAVCPQYAVVARRYGLRRNRALEGKEDHVAQLGIGKGVHLAGGKLDP